MRVMEEILGDSMLKDFLILTFTPTFNKVGGSTFGSVMGVV